MEELIWNEETIRKSRSPYSIYFYLKKTNGNREEVPAKIIGSIYNLRYVSRSENSKKQNKCSIDLKTLLENYENGNQD